MKQLNTQKITQKFNKKKLFKFQKNYSNLHKFDILQGCIIIGIAYFFYYLSKFLLFPISFIPSLYNFLSAKFMKVLWSYFQIFFENKFQKIHITGDHIFQDIPCSIFLLDHGTAADFFVMNSFSSECGLESSLKFLIWSKLDWHPSLRKLFGSKIINSFWNLSPKEIENFKLIIENNIKTKNQLWLAFFIELPEKSNNHSVANYRKVDKRYWAMKNEFDSKNDEIPKLMEFLKTIESHVYIYDINIKYLSNTNKEGVYSIISTPSLLQIYSSRNSSFSCSMDIRRYPLKSLPKDQDELKKWFENLLIKKDNYRI